MDDARAPGPATLERSVAAWQRARAALEADNELVADERILMAALDADPTVLAPDDVLRRMVRAMVFARARAEEAKAFQQTMKLRELRYRSREGTLRGVLLDLLDAYGRKSFASPYGTVSLRAGTPSAVILDAQAVPDEYVTTTRTLDRRAILADLKQGVLIDGAVLSNGAPTIALTTERGAVDLEQAEADVTTQPEANVAAADAITGREWG